MELKQKLAELSVTASFFTSKYREGGLIFYFKINVRGWLDVLTEESCAKRTLRKPAILQTGSLIPRIR